MEFANETLRTQYRTKKLCLPMQEVVLILECLARRDPTMPHGLTITSLFRPKDTKSYHSLWQAVDIRTKDWGPKFHAAVLAAVTAIKSLDPCCQFEFEPNARHPNSDPHLHLEFDDGSLKK